MMLPINPKGQRSAVRRQDPPASGSISTTISVCTPCGCEPTLDTASSSPLRYCRKIQLTGAGSIVLGGSSVYRRFRDASRRRQAVSQSLLDAPTTQFAPHHQEQARRGVFGCSSWAGGEPTHAKAHSTGKHPLVPTRPRQVRDCKEGSVAVTHTLKRGTLRAVTLGALAPAYEEVQTSSRQSAGAHLSSAHSANHI